MSRELWTTVDRYLTDLFLPSDPVLDAVLDRSVSAGLPPIHVPPSQGKFLMLLAQIQGARHILEFGTLGGYSTIWLARGLSPGGRVVTLESEARYAAVARINFESAGLSGVVDLRVGRAEETLPGLVAEGHPPFDLIFMDADRPHYPEHFAWALRLSRPGTVIVADNVIRDGAVANPASADAGVQGVRRFHEIVAAEPRVSAVAVQTVSGKGYDGFALLRVLDA